MCLEDGADPGSTLLSLWTEKKDERLGQKVQAAMRRKAVKGEVLGRPPFGYRVGPRRRLEIVPEEAAVVRYIFRLYLRDGLGIRLIARRLNEEGMRTHRNGLWSMVTVRDILRNRTYLGTYSRFGVRVPASHPALISNDDFRRVQERLSSRRQERAQRQTSLFLLSGLAYCGYCGNKMIGVSRRQRWHRRDGSEKLAEYRYYQCESRTNCSLCDYHTRRAGQLEEEVRQALLGEEPLAVQAVARAGDEAAVLQEAEARCLRLRGRLRRLDKRLEEYMNEAARGRLSAQRMRSLSVDVAAEELSLEESLAEAERFVRQQASAAERQQQKERALAGLRDQWDHLAPLGRQALLGELLERVVVWDDSIRILLRL
jgi:site-specific DNA recombinase